MEDVTVMHVKDGVTCDHADLSITRALQDALECMGKWMHPADRISATESLRIRQDVWHDGVKIWRG